MHSTRVSRVPSELMHEVIVLSGSVVAFARLAERDMTSSVPEVRVLRFENFELDVRAGELRKGGVKLRLQGQPLQVLESLLRHAGDVVTREELRAQIWKTDTFVDFDHSLHNAIARVREVLGDSADNPRYIETLPRRGYRFLVPVESHDGLRSAGAPAPIPISPDLGQTGHGRRTKVLVFVLLVGTVSIGILSLNRFHQGSFGEPRSHPVGSLAPIALSSRRQRIWRVGPVYAPETTESAGKRISSKIRKGRPWLRRMACQSAWAAARTKNPCLSAQFKKLAARRGRKCAIIAVAHSILVIGYHLQPKRCAYTDLGGNYFDRLHAEGLKRYLVKRLEGLGHSVTLQPRSA